MSNNKHPDWNEVFSVAPEFMAETLGNLKYDELAAFLELLARKIEADGEKDQARGRIKLAAALQDAAKNIDGSAKAINRAWAISRPYMK